MLFETRQVDQFEDWDGAIRGLKLQGCIRQGCIRLDDRGSIRILTTEGTRRNTGEGLSFACVRLVLGPLDCRRVILWDCLSDCESDFAMLTCATNVFQCLASGCAVCRAADRHFSASESLLVVVDCGGATDRCDLAGAASGDSATATRRSGAFAAGHAMAGVCAGLPVRDSLVCRNLLLDL